MINGDQEAKKRDVFSSYDHEQDQAGSIPCESGRSFVATIVSITRNRMDSDRIRHCGS